jgi:hypothetical protein
VPVDAKIYIEPRILDGFPDGRAWTEEGGIVAVDTLLGADPNSDAVLHNNHALYDSANLTADGYQMASPLALIGAARTMVLDAATLVISYTQVGVATLAPEMFLAATDGDDAIKLDISSSSRKAAVGSFNGDLFNETTATLNVGEGAINGLAATTTLTRFDIALNGSPAVAGVVTDTDRPPSNPFTTVPFADAGGSPVPPANIRFITIYDALPSTDGLSTLSDIGVLPPPPVLSNATATATGSNTADISVDTDVLNGSLGWILTINNDTPSATAIFNGLDGIGSPAAFAGLMNGVSSSPIVDSASSGLDPDTTYYFFAVQRDVNSQYSNVIAAAPITTDP